MFSLASGFYENYFVPPEVSCLIVGLDGAGKTALLERIKVTDFSVRRASTGKRIIIRRGRNFGTIEDTGIDEKDTNLISLRIDEKHDRSIPLRIPHENSSPSRRTRFTCPAPRSYKQTKYDSDEDTKDLKRNDKHLKHSIIQLPSGKASLSPPASPPKHTLNATDTTLITRDKYVESNNCDIKINTTYEQCDLRSGKEMFPLHLIRPTLGMNLGKIEACGAKVRCMDLGGTMKMRPLWERYYNDVHAIIFVIDVSPSCEVSKLMEARAYYRCMCDDSSLRNIPILIFANKTDTRGIQKYVHNGDKDEQLFLGETSLLDIAELFLSPPRGSSELGTSQCYCDNENVSMFAGSAKTGEGIVAAFDWLIKSGIERVRKIQKNGKI